MKSRFFAIAVLLALSMSARIAPAQKAPIQLVLPMQGTLEKDFFITGFVPHPRGDSAVDYEGGKYAAAGVPGTDFVIGGYLYGMDQGHLVLAAADGIVTGVHYTEFDRHTWTGTPGEMNYITILHPNGITTRYNFLRKNSTLVSIGDEVVAGEPIGMIGASGEANGPDLRFIVYDSNGVELDPFTGSQNASPSLWLSQPTYYPRLGTKLIDIMLDTKDNLGTAGDFWHITFDTMYAGLVRVNTFGLQDDDWAGFEIFYQALPTDGYTIHLVDDKTTQLEWNNSHTSPGDNPSLQRDNQAYEFGTYLNTSNYGPWHLDFYSALGALEGTVHFNVGPHTIYYPDFDHHGLVLRANGTLQRDTLHLRSPGGTGPMSLLETIPGVTLHDSIVAYTGVPIGPVRLNAFHVQVVNQAGLYDTATYYIVDSTEPQNASPVAAPALLYPKNGQVALPKSVAVKWADAPGATSYQIQIASDSNFTTVLQDTTVLHGTVFAPAGLLAGNWYYWRVKITNGENPSGWSARSSFEINSPPIVQASDVQATLGVRATLPVSVADEMLSQVMLRVHSGDQAIVPDSTITVSGTGASRNISVLPIANGKTTLTLTAADLIDTTVATVNVTAGSSDVAVTPGGVKFECVVHPERSSFSIVRAGGGGVPAIIRVFSLLGVEELHWEGEIETEKSFSIPSNGICFVLVTTSRGQQLFSCHL